MAASTPTKAAEIAKMSNAQLIELAQEMHRRLDAIEKRLDAYKAEQARKEA